MLMCWMGTVHVPAKHGTLGAFSEPSIEADIGSRSTSISLTGFPYMAKAQPEKVHC